jgi:hypothetical protein
MASERLAPDALLDQTNLEGSVADVDDDPDSPDGSWLTASNNNADSVARVSFPSPTGSPTVGTDLQEFRALVRKAGGSGTPEARIELYEDGSLVRAGDDQGITGDTVLALTWNASELATANGALVECRVYGTKSGGAPAARATIEVGAVEWNAEYSESLPDVELSGELAGAGSVSGALEVTRAVGGEAGGAGAVSGSLEVTRTLSGSTAGAGSVTGDAEVTRLLVGEVTGTGAISGTLDDQAPTVELSGSASGAGAVAGDLEVTRLLAGVAAGAGAVAGDLEVSRLLSGDAVGTGAISGAIADQAPAVELSGSATGAGTVAGDAEVSRLLSGNAPGAGAASGAAEVSRLLGGTAVGAGTVHGELEVGGVVALSGELQGGLSATAALEVARLLVGTLAGSSAISGSLSTTDETDFGSLPAATRQAIRDGRNTRRWRRFELWHLGPGLRSTYEDAIEAGGDEAAEVEAELDRLVKMRYTGTPVGGRRR